MIIRFQVWRARRRARYLSKWHRWRPIEAQVNGITVGEFYQGREK